MNKEARYMLGDKIIHSKIEEESPHIIALKDNQDSNKENNDKHSNVIEGQVLEQMSEKDIADSINKSIESIPSILQKLFLNNEFIDDLLDQLYSENYNKLTPRNRLELFLQLNAFTSQCIGNDLLEAPVNIVDKPIDGQYLAIEEGKTYVDRDFFDKKYGGLSLITGYVNTFAQYLIIQITDGAYATELNPELLSKRALVFYENMQTSYLIGSWNNLLERDNDRYEYQPIVSTAISLANQINMQYIKYLYNKYKNIDPEMSSFINGQMVYDNKFNKLQKEVKESIKKARENITNSKETELVSYNKFIDRTAMDLSKFTDQEFYELFNLSYANALNEYEDPTVGDRLANMANELINRELKDYDTSKIDIPVYSTNYDMENAIMTFKKVVNNELSSVEISGSGDAFVLVLQDLISICVENGFFKFENDQEKKDYVLMLTWKNIKDQLGYDKTDKEIISDGLNIINLKVSELLCSLNNKINDAIKVSEFMPHNKSMIAYDNKEALYDYHEFKNCHTKEEMTQAFNDIVQLDLKENIDKYKDKLNDILKEETKDTPHVENKKGGRR